MPRSPHPIDTVVGFRIGARRAALGLSQGALAQRLGISAQQVQKYEAGANRISASRLVQIASVLGVSAAALLPETGVDGPDDGVPSLGPSGMQGRLQAAFPRIADRRVQHALTRIAEALAQPA